MLYVASYRLASPAVLHKASRQNFSASEIAILTGKVEEKLFIIQSKLTNTVIQTKRKMKCGVKLRRLSTPKELHRGQLPKSEKNGKIYTHKPKKSSQNWPKSRKKTVGGEAPKIPVAAIAKTIDPLKETPSFAGLEGLESKGDDYYPIVFKT